jgi:hypothetical protein
MQYHRDGNVDHGSPNDLSSTQALPFLLLFTYRLASPVIGIRIKDKLTLTGEGQIKQQRKRSNSYDGQPLQPNRTARPFVIRRKGEQDQQEQDEHLDLLT